MLNIIIVAFHMHDDALNVALIARKGVYMLPRDTLDTKESLDQAAQRISQHTLGTQLRSAYIEQLYTFNSTTASATVAYFVLVAREVSIAHATINWFDVQKLPNILASNRQILSYATKRLQWKLEYTNVAYSLLPKEFTLSELQHVYEVILGTTLDKRNFRKKIASVKLLVPTKHKKRDGIHRPATLYRFIQHKPLFVSIV